SASSAKQTWRLLLHRHLLRMKSHTMMVVLKPSIHLHSFQIMGSLNAFASRGLMCISLRQASISITSCSCSTIMSQLFQIQKHYMMDVSLYTYPCHWASSCVDILMR